ELVFLLDGDPRELEPLPLALLVQLGVLGLDLRQLVPRCLPFLASSYLVLGHRHLLRSARHATWWTVLPSTITTGADRENHRDSPAASRASVWLIWSFT